MAFLEEQLNQQFGFGSNVTEEYAVNLSETKNGNEYRALRHPYPILTIDLTFTNRTETYIFDNIIDFYQRSAGMFGGFRWKNPVDYSTNARTGAETFDDQACVLDGTDYQITKWYGVESAATSSRRRIRKPVSGTVLVGIRDDFSNPVEILNPGSPRNWTVDTTTGLITFKANNQKTVTGITQAASAVITVGASHGYVANDSVHVSGVAGMTEINGLRGTVQSVGASTITVDINSLAFTAFSLASPNLAVVNTAPQTNEVVTAGCEFDIPVRFESDLAGLSFLTKNPTDNIMGATINLIEVLNP